MKWYCTSISSRTVQNVVSVCGWNSARGVSLSLEITAVAVMRRLMTSAQSAIVQVQLYSTVEALSGNWSLVTSSAPDSWPHSGLQTVAAIHYSVQAVIQRIQSEFSFISGPRFILPAHLITNAVYWKHHRYVLRFTVLNPPGLLYSTVHYVVRLLCRMYVFITNNTFTTNNLGVIIHKTCCNKKTIIYTNKKQNKLYMLRGVDNKHYLRLKTITYWNNVLMTLIA